MSQIDFRKIDSQEVLEALFKETNFYQRKDCAFGQNGNAIKIDPPDADSEREEGDTHHHQFVWIGECEYMGCLTVADMEGHGYDALFVQTLVQLFRDGKLKMME